MTSFTASPLLIALMQTATTLPVFLVGFPAGALADIVNRRRLLLATQGLILAAAAALSVLTWASLMNVPLLPGISRPHYRGSGVGRGVPPQRHRLPVRGRRALSLAPRAPQSGPARRTPGRRHEDGSALCAELTGDADSAHTHLLLYLFHQRAVGIAASDSQAGSAPWRSWIRAAARLHRRGRCGGRGCVAADPTQDSRGR